MLPRKIGPHTRDGELLDRIEDVNRAAFRREKQRDGVKRPRAQHEGTLALQVQWQTRYEGDEGVWYLKQERHPTSGLNRTY